jgi:hypothetical protein
MNRIWSSLGCFGLALLAIVYALGVTQTIKYASPLVKMLVLTAAVVAAAVVAFVRDRIKNDFVPALRKSERKKKPTQEERFAQRFKDQRAKTKVDAVVVSQAFSPVEPEPDLPIHDTILASRTQAIIFRQIVPPNHDPHHLSFFGGLPIAPSGFQWPRGQSRPYSFIMQVDCSAVPAEGRLGMFPDRGVMYLFLDLDWGQEDTFRVIWQPGPTLGWTEITEPGDLPHAYDHKRSWKWPQSDADWPRLLPKWPFDPVLIRGGPLPDDEEELEQTYAWPGTINPDQAISAIEGAVVPYKDFEYKRRHARIVPFANFPHDWNAVRITTGLITERMDRSVEEARTRYFRELSEEEFEAKVAEAQGTLRDWSDRASAATAFDEVPPPERDQFWSWLQDHEWLVFMPMIYAGHLSVEATLTAGPEAAARVPLEVVDYVRHRHALAVKMESALYVNIPDRMLAPPVDVQGTIDDRVREFILLFEMGSNEGLAHYFGEGVYQFWIRPDDLAARRFDRVELSTTAY